MEIKILKYGLYYNGVLYCWMNKFLYRMPYNNHKTERSYYIKEIKVIGNHYIIGRNKVHINTIKNRTIELNYRYEYIPEREVPF